jgi:GNAT superfamily N-acetyltransferase
VSIERLDPATETDLAAFHRLHVAAHPVDRPEEPSPTRGETDAWATRGWSGEPRETWLLRDGDRVIGAAAMSLPDRENLHLVELRLTVHPEHRRTGHGRCLLEHVIARTRELGRRLVIGEAIDGRPGEAFASAVGAQRAVADAMRRLDLRPDDDLVQRQAALLEEARKHADGYELLAWTGPAPEDLIDDVATLLAAMNDAPMDDLEWEDEVWDPDRVRQVEAYQEGMGQRSHVIVARQTETGELGGLTDVAVLPPDWTYAQQGDTCVSRAHRGHRLGLLVKLSMIERLRAEEPQLRVIDTWNAASNTHMVAVNEAIGCRVIRTQAEWQLAVD